MFVELGVVVSCEVVVYGLLVAVVVNGSSEVVAVVVFVELSFVVPYVLVIERVPVAVVAG